MGLHQQKHCQLGLKKTENGKMAVSMCCLSRKEKKVLKDDSEINGAATPTTGPEERIIAPCLLRVEIPV